MFPNIKEGKSMTRTILALFLLALLGPLGARPAAAGITYQLDSGTGVYGSFNNSQGSETEDNFVANSFTVVPGGTHLTAVEFSGIGVPNGQSATAVIYSGSSLTSPSAGGGLVLLSSTS